MCVCLSLCISPDAHKLMLRLDGWEREAGEGGRPHSESGDKKKEVE